MNPSQEPAQPYPPGTAPAGQVPWSPPPSPPGPAPFPAGAEQGFPHALGGAYAPPPPYAFGPDGGFGAEPPRRSLRTTVWLSIATALTIAVLGGPLGLLWSWIAPSVPVIDTGQNGIVVNDPSPEEYIAADGWFALLGFAFGLLVAIVAWLAVRKIRGPGLVLGVTAGALAAAPVAWQVGRRVGLAAFQRWQDSAAVGATFGKPPDLHAYGTMLVPAFAAVIVTTLLAGWSNDPELDAPGAKPGYSNNVIRRG